MAKDKSRKKSKQPKKPDKPAVKPAAVIVTGINDQAVKPATPPAATNTAANLCDECAYEFGACDGIPKFASEADPTLKGTEADRVVECKAFVNVQSMPTADEIEKAREAGASVADQEEEPVHVIPIPGATEEAKKADDATMKADLEARQKKIQRFNREEDLGKCPACDRPLKRTALNRDRDAVRCTNPRCRQYRAVVRNIPAE